MTNKNIVQYTDFNLAEILHLHDDQTRKVNGCFPLLPMHMEQNYYRST